MDADTRNHAQLSIFGLLQMTTVHLEFTLVDHATQS